MSKRIVIEPLTKLEGHGKVTIQLDEHGNVASAHFHVTEFRGFEKFCEGRMLWDMPVITTRICGICPVSHHLASVKACEGVLGVEPPAAAKKMRELMHMGQFIHSHSLHFFFLAAPDFIVGPDAEPVKRSIVGVIEKEPELAKKAIHLRKIGQTIVDKVGGRAIHPVTAIPGGMSRPLSHEDRYHLLKEIPTAVELATLAVQTAKRVLQTYAEKLPSLGDFPTMYMGMVNDGSLQLYDGTLRIKDANGQNVDEFEPSDYLKYIGEHVEENSYLKFPFYKKEGWPQGIYRVGPLARLNVADKISTPLAAAELEEFKALKKDKPVSENLYYHYARTIEMLYAVERAKELLEDDEIVSTEYRIKVERKEGEGVGVIEAPRGTLIHHYWADPDGRVLKVNLIVATAHNNKAIDISVGEMAKKYISNGQLSEGIMNRLEMAIRCYDPCLSCSTHAIGEMPLEVLLYSKDGELLDRIWRG